MAGTIINARIGAASGVRVIIAGRRLIKAKSTLPTTIQADATVGAFFINISGDADRVCEAPSLSCGDEGGGERVRAACGR